MSNPFTRRQFLVTSAAASAVVLGRPFFNIDSAYAASFVRRDIGGIAETDQIIVSYRKAIKAMQALPATNPLSWTYQAAIHGISPGNGNMTAWNTCQHGYICPSSPDPPASGSPFFLAWHRMYLYWFERIIRQMSGDPDWALPYWNWSCSSQRVLPPMFRDPVNAPELFVPDPNRGQGGGVNNGSFALDNAIVAYSAAFLDSAFYSCPPGGFDYDLQLAPHNNVHNALGGWMGSPQTAAQDPIFFLHHANIDRLWNLWLAQGGNRGDPVTDSNWTSQTFTFFDETGNQVQQTPCDVLRTSGQLGYTYEGECPEVNQYCGNGQAGGWVIVTIDVLELSLLPFSISSTNFTTSIGVLPPQFWQAIERGENVNLQLNNMEALHPPGVSWEVYVGLPPGAQPSTDSPFYVGLISLFATGILDQQSHHGAQAAFSSFVINRAVLASPTGGPLPLTFVVHPILIYGKATKPEVQSPVTVGGVSLAITKNVYVGPNSNP
jgi:tyrosinase